MGFCEVSFVNNAKSPMSSPMQRYRKYHPDLRYWEILKHLYKIYVEETDTNASAVSLRPHMHNGFREQRLILSLSNPKIALRLKSTKTGCTPSSRRAVSLLGRDRRRPALAVCENDNFPRCLREKKVSGMAKSGKWSAGLWWWIFASYRQLHMDNWLIVTCCWFFQSHTPGSTAV